MANVKSGTEDGPMLQVRKEVPQLSVALVKKQKDQN